MTATLITRNEAQEDSNAILAGLGTSISEVTGSLLASADGHPLASNLNPAQEKSTAAIVASSFALGQKLAEVGGSATAEEMIVRHENGYVALYAVGFEAALVVLTTQDINLGMLKLKSAVAVKELGILIPALFTRGVQ